MILTSLNEKEAVNIVGQLTSVQHKTINYKCFRSNFCMNTSNQAMTNPVKSMVISLGNEPAEALGFKTEEQIETALLPLMEEIFTNETIPVK